MIFEFESLGPQGLFFLREKYMAFYEKIIKFLGGICMFKDMNKFEKAGLIIGGIECIVGFGVAMYAHRKLVKEQSKSIQETINETNEIIENINNILDNE